MNIQKFILNLFPAHRKVLFDLVVAKQETASVRQNEQQWRRDCTLLDKDLSQVRAELAQVRARLINQLQKQKQNSETSLVNLTNAQILKLISISGNLPEIQEELIRAYEKGIELKLQRANQLSN